MIDDAHALGPNVPQTSRRWLRRLGAGWMHRMGWRFEGRFPDVPKMVVIAAPHTSNWDFIALLAAKWALGLDVRWLGKDSLFVPPLGWFMRAIGGVPVNRALRGNMVSASVEEFRRRDRFVLVLAPEGTRRRVREWKTGFWFVAREAHVPIACVALDWHGGVIRLGPTTRATESDAAAGIARVRSAFDGLAGHDARRR